MSDAMHPELLADARATLGEGPVWDMQREVLWWVDIEGRTVCRWAHQSGSQVAFQTPERVSGLAVRRDGGLILALETGFWVADADGNDLVQWVALPEANSERRLNDVKCDPGGRLWSGSMRFDQAEGGGDLYRVDPDGTVTVMLQGVTIPNGMAWSADGQTMYFIDSPTRRIDGFDFEASTGSIARRRTAVDLADQDGVPDGMTIDQQGFLWVAMWGGAAILRCQPGARAGEAGRVVERVSMPVRQPTSCTFGGAGLAELYITSARQALPDRSDSLDGGLFRLRVAARGRPAEVFAG
jgi:sugar lactone lactonase YvrE